MFIQADDIVVFLPIIPPDDAIADAPRDDDLNDGYWEGWLEIILRLTTDDKEWKM